MVCLLCIAWFTAASASMAQEATPTLEQEEEQEQPSAKLPEPVSGIAGSLADLEETGYFEIVDAVYARTKELDEPAVIWTVKVTKPITCRHAILLLRQLSDVRFYRTGEDWRKEILAAELYHSSRIGYEAVHHRIMRRDEQFEVWVLLSQWQVWMLNHEQADSIEFVPLRRYQTVR
jgi:hypothetical protein